MAEEADEQSWLGRSRVYERREMSVDLDTLVEIATEEEDYMDLTYERSGYLDTETGAVHIIYRDSFRCADGDLEPEDLEEWAVEDVELAGAILSDSKLRYIQIERWNSSEEYELMEEFAEAVSNSRARIRLLESIQGRRPFRAFKDTIAEWPELRETWFLFREHARRERARVWLLNFGIVATDGSTRQLAPPPENW